MYVWTHGLLSSYFSFVPDLANESYFKSVSMSFGMPHYFASISLIYWHYKVEYKDRRREIRYEGITVI